MVNPQVPYNHVEVNRIQEDPTDREQTLIGKIINLNTVADNTLNTDSDEVEPLAEKEEAELDREEAIKDKINALMFAAPDNSISSFSESL